MDVQNALRDQHGWLARAVVDFAAYSMAELITSYLLPDPKAHVPLAFVVALICTSKFADLHRSLSKEGFRIARDATA